MGARSRTRNIRKLAPSPIERAPKLGARKNGTTSRRPAARDPANSGRRTLRGFTTLTVPRIENKKISQRNQSSLIPGGFLFLTDKNKKQKNLGMYKCMVGLEPEGSYPSSTSTYPAAGLAVGIQIYYRIHNLHARQSIHPSPRNISSVNL